MKALTIKPKEKSNTQIIDLDKPILNEDEILVKVLQAGICRTDVEIYQGLYGETPDDDDYLIMGHESLGVVESIGHKVSDFDIGDYVVRTVRRPCKDGCVNCLNEENDMCLTGNYIETGIKGLHGIMVEFYKDKPDYLVKVPEEHQSVGVLLEPLSFAEKAVSQSLKIQRRMHWSPKNALVLGSGPIGLLATMILRSKEIETYTAARSKKSNHKSKIVEETGAHYLSTSETSLEEEFSDKNLDLIVEATGDARAVYDAINILGTNGILCLTSITGDDQKIDFPLSRVNLDLVLGNKAIVGVVNSNVEDYRKGVGYFADFERRWPDLTESLITKRIPIEKYKVGFEGDRQDIKTVIDFRY